MTKQIKIDVYKYSSEIVGLCKIPSIVNGLLDMYPYCDTAVSKQVTLPECIECLSQSMEKLYEED